jgi:hypothetical protein
MVQLATLWLNQSYIDAVSRWREHRVQSGWFQVSMHFNHGRSLWEVFYRSPDPLLEVNSASSSSTLDGEKPPWWAEKQRLA